MLFALLPLSPRSKLSSRFALDLLESSPMILLAAGFDVPAALMGGALGALLIILVFTLSDLTRYLFARRRWRALFHEVD